MVVNGSHFHIKGHHLKSRYQWDPFENFRFITVDRNDVNTCFTGGPVGLLKYTGNRESYRMITSHARCR